ncbi:MAG: hypothetical protein QW112_00090 [Candidatus Micrarchaeia archaeon]
MARQVTWKQVLDRGVLGAYRGQGIFCELTHKELEIIDRISKGDLSTYNSLKPEIKEIAKRTGDSSLVPVMQFERYSSSIDKNHGLSQDQITYMATDNYIKKMSEKNPNLTEILNPLRNNLGLAKFTIEMVPSEKQAIINNLNKDIIASALMPQFMKENIAAAILRIGKQHDETIAQKIRMDKQIYMGMDFLIKKIQDNYAMLSPMLLYTITKKSVDKWIADEIKEAKKKVEEAEKKEKKADAKKAKNELEFLMRLAEKEGILHIYLQLVAQRIIVPPRHLKIKSKDVPEPGKLMLAVSKITKGLRAVLGVVVKHIRKNEKRIESDLAKAMLKFQQA